MAKIKIKGNKQILQNFNDWFLPSTDELNAMYLELHLFGMGGFSDVNYWTSSERNATTAYIQNFTIGTQANAFKNAGGGRTRPIRSFTARVGAYSLRDTGPAGGLIFHIAGGTTYYESWLFELSTTQIWSNIINVLIGTTGTVIGTGQANTDLIIAQDGHTDSAAKLCIDFSVNNYIYTTSLSAYPNKLKLKPIVLNKLKLYNFYAIYDDWFLPSSDELSKIQIEIYSHAIGNLIGAYWSSSENLATTAWLVSMPAGPTPTAFGKVSSFKVRACRAFTSTTNYNLRDIGPAGGWIFWKSGNNYLEVAASDQSASQVWSNVTNVAVGTGTAIGTGQANTDAIIAQDGHTNSAAKLCIDFVV